MKYRDWALVLLVLLCANFANAGLILHLQSPYRDDPVKSDESIYKYHVTGATVSSWGADYDTPSKTRMTPEKDHWFSFKWDKSLSEYSNGGSFSISICTDTADVSHSYNNKCEEWTVAKNLSLTELFENETELWLYTKDDEAFEKSIIAPGSNMLWFKSPWGNRSLPLVVFGKDSILMRPADNDKTKCGWFFAPISPAINARNTNKTATFTRYKAPYIKLPAIDLKAAMANSAIYVDGTAAKLAVSAKMGTVGTCFDSTRTLHIYHPWRTNSTFKDSSFYITVGDNILNQETKLTRDSYDRWWKYDFSTAVTSKKEWSSSAATLQIIRKKDEWPRHEIYASGTKPTMKELFPRGVYETWLYTRDNGIVDVLYAPLEPKIVRVKSPWENMSPILILPTDTIKMGPFSKDTCGWYQGTIFKHTSDFSVYLRQAFGLEYFDAKGPKSSNNKLTTIKLDSILTKGDTVYVMPSPTLTSPLKVFKTFPKSFGQCPQLTLNVRVLDWAGEGIILPGGSPYDLKTDFSKDVDFGGIWAGNEFTKVKYLDKESKLIKENQKCDGLVVGMVQDTLVNGAPARVDSLDFPWEKCSAGREIEKWFVPEIVASDRLGNEYTNATCYEIPMTLDEEGFWLVDISENDPNQGFFPLDDFKYLDDAKTVWNPKYDSTCIRNNNDGQLYCHNFSFSMKVAAQFQYIKGQYFEFRGDDDVWVFINNRLVVDIGGCHSPLEAGVALDTIGDGLAALGDDSQKLVEGKTYSFHIFFSERNATGSNFKMRTSINLQTEKTYYFEERIDDNGVSTVELLQRMVDKNQSCDEGSVAQAKVLPANSTFFLIKPDGTEEILTEGKTYYNGITIKKSSFILDTAAISAAHESGDGLAAGNYVLKFCKETGSECDSYSFVIAVPQPTIAFADSSGYIINADTVKFGEYSSVLYPVWVKVLYRGNICTSDMCKTTLSLSSPDTSFSFYDMQSRKIDKIPVDSTGSVHFYVRSSTPIKNGSFKVYDEELVVANELEWKNINLEKAPVPPLRLATMHDRDGDGIGDSLHLAYEDVLKSNKYILDSVAWAFGDTTWHVTGPNSSVLLHVKDSSFTLFADSLYSFKFTGSIGEVYSGSCISHYRYFKEDTLTGTIDTIPMTLMGFISDRVPPMVSKAIVIPKTEKINLLNVFFTESLDSVSVRNMSLLKFKVKYDGKDVSEDLIVRSVAPAANGGSVQILFEQSPSGALPSVGDSVRFAPDIATDLSGNKARSGIDQWAWVRIEGEQTLRTENTKVLEITSKSLNGQKQAMKAYAVSAEKSFKQMEDEIGLPGILVRYDMSELLLGDTTGLTPADISIKLDNYVFTNLGSFLNSKEVTVRCDDKSLFDGDCSKKPMYLYFAWNGLSEEGRAVGTGAYVFKYEIKVSQRGKKKLSKSSSSTFGIRRIE